MSKHCAIGDIHELWGAFSRSSMILCFLMASAVAACGGREGAFHSAGEPAAGPATATEAGVAAIAPASAGASGAHSGRSAVGATSAGTSADHDAAGGGGSEDVRDTSHASGAMDSAAAGASGLMNMHDAAGASAAMDARAAAGASGSRSSTGPAAVSGPPVAPSGLPSGAAGTSGAGRLVPSGGAGGAAPPPAAPSPEACRDQFDQCIDDNNGNVLSDEAAITNCIPNAEQCGLFPGGPGAGAACLATLKSCISTNPGGLGPCIVAGERCGILPPGAGMCYDTFLVCSIDVFRSLDCLMEARACGLSAVIPWLD